MISLPSFIAWRYLFAKKSHNVINIISAISAIGMGIGTASLIIILSIYNGFDFLVKSSLSNIEPDIKIYPAKGKVFIPKDDFLGDLYDSPLIFNISSVLEETVFISYNGNQTVVKAKGVDTVFEEESPISESIIDGKFTLHFGSIPATVIGKDIAYKLGINPRFLSYLEIFYPQRKKNISISNPYASIKKEALPVTGLLNINPEIDNSLIVVPLETMRSLLDYKDEVSAIEIRLNKGTSKQEEEELIKSISQVCGDGFKVYDRFEQNKSLYKMMKYEKAAITLILIFIIIIIGFNIFGSLSMLIIEKKQDLSILKAMGMTYYTIRKIFILEGWLISMSGVSIGLITGVLFSFLQQTFGIIGMPGQFSVSAYPVIINIKDIIMTAISIAFIGYLIAAIPVKYYINFQERT